METRLQLEILPQPDDTTCGPTCLHAVYRFFGEQVPLGRVISEVPSLKSGGTLAVLLASHALKRGYDATICTYNLQMFDPTWFAREEPYFPVVDIAARLRHQLKRKKNTPRMKFATQAYREFLTLGGALRFEDLTTALIRKYLQRGVPILTGLSATYLYRSMREYGKHSEYDDVRGDPAGHFVVLCGYDKVTRTVLIADPFLANPMSGPDQFYLVDIDRLVCSILLGILTYDANLLIIEPKKVSKQTRFIGKMSFPPPKV